MLLPALGKARAKARNAQCLNNLKQIGLVTSMYIGDYNDSFFPYGLFPNGLFYYSTMPNKNYDGTAGGIGWAAFRKNLKYAEYRVLVCPSKAKSKTNGYGYNYRVLGEDATAGNGRVYRPRLLSKCAEPSQQYVFMDSQKADGDMTSQSNVMGTKDNVNYSPSPRHDGVVNIVYADGHASGIMTSATIQDTKNVFLEGAVGVGTFDGGGTVCYPGCYNASSGWCRFK